MRNVISVCTIFIILSSCNNEGKVNANRDLKFIVDSLQCVSDSNNLYFPMNEKLPDTSNLQIDKAANLAYSRILYALHEPILYNCADTSTIFRFTWIRTFHNPISIRILKHLGNYVLTLKVTDGQGGYESGKLIKDTSFYVSNDEWNDFNAQLGKANFWNLSSLFKEDGKDGAEWILEAKVSQKYHVVNRWAPNQMRYKAFRDCCEILIRMSDINIPDKQMY